VSSLGPNLAGFRDAQVRLNAAMGNDVSFRFAASGFTYPPGTPIDPETGKAMDPFVEPLTEIDFPTASARATVVRTVPTTLMAGEDQRAGLINDGEIWLRLPEGTYDPVIYRSRGFVLFGESYRVTRFVFGGNNAIIDHLYVHGVLTNRLDASVLSPQVGSGAITAGPYYQESFTATMGQTVFALQFPFISGSTEVFIDGIRQSLGPSFDYQEVGQSVVLSDNSIFAGQLVTVAYLTA
jgi:hypothetical protein